MPAEPISAFVLATRNPHKLAEVSRLLAPAGIAVDPLPDDVTLITSAEEIAREVAATLERRGVGNLAGREGGYRFLCTGDEQAFQDVAGRFLQLPLTEVERVDPARLEIAA